ncbi:MAG: hypothetical protein C0603_04415 [Denitrovibrio sp.]|nr:MAG: hypothetical protein C0603_04415 [Denitrovibrio sp.]
MNMQIEKIDDTKSKLVVGGNLTVENITKFHKQLCDLYKEVNELVISIQKGAQFDLTFVQIICTAHRDFNAADKKLCMDGDLNGLFIKTDEIGYTRHKGCSIDKNHNCVLVKKGA